MTTMEGRMMETPMLLVATRAGLRKGTAHDEEVLVDTHEPGAVVLRLEDGECMTFDRVELLAALEVDRREAG